MNNTRKILFLLSLLLIVFSSCEKIEEVENTVPDFSNLKSENVTAYSAYVSCDVISNGGRIKEYGFYYGTTFPDIKVEASKNGSTISLSFKNLEAATKYVYCAYVSNGIQTVKSTTREFETKSTIPTVLTSGVSDYTTGMTASYTLSGNVTKTGGQAVTERGILLSTTGYVSIDSYSKRVSNGKGVGSFKCTFDGLNPGKTYYYVAYAINVHGIAYGDVKSFTIDALTPFIKTLDTSTFDATDAYLSSEIQSDGGSAITEHGILVSTSSSVDINYYQFKKYSTSNSLGVKDFYFSGLSPVTTYYYVAYARNAMGISYGEVKSFMTNVALASITTGSAVNEDKSATLYGSISNNGGSSITECGILLSTSSNVSLNNYSYKRNTGTRSGSFSLYFDGLTPKTTYYYVAYAVNSRGVSYGTVWSFRTVVAAKSLTIEPETIYMVEGQSRDLKCIKNPTNSTDDIDWSLSYTSYMSINSTSGRLSSFTTTGYSRYSNTVTAKAKPDASLGVLSDVKKTANVYVYRLNLYDRDNGNSYSSGSTITVSRSSSGKYLFFYNSDYKNSGYFDREILSYGSGDYSYSVSSSNTSIATVEVGYYSSNYNAECIKIVPKATGTCTLKVTVGYVTRSFTIKVVN